MYLPNITDTDTGFTTHLRHAARQHRLLFVIVFFYAMLSLGISLAIHTTTVDQKLTSLVNSFLSMLPMMAYFLLAWRYLTQRFTVPVEHRKGWLKADLKRTMTDPDRLASALIGLLLMVVVLVSFAQLKRLIPIIQPFAWDESFIALDQAIHFGVNPWRIAHAIAGYSLVITFLTGAYNFWLFLMYFSLIFACFSTANRVARMQYLVAFVLTWAIGGNLFATIFSSAGPVYVERLGLGEYFAPLLTILQTHAQVQPITVVETQDLLWSFYIAPESLSGISAFPSMHVASTTLMALYAAAYNRRFGQIMTGFAVVIMLGSVLLAWHYAVDGYAGALIALACWWGAGRLVRRFQPE